MADPRGNTNDCYNLQSGTRRGPAIGTGEVLPSCTRRSKDLSERAVLQFWEGLTHAEFAERAQEVLKTVSLKLCEFAAKEVQTPPPQEPPPGPTLEFQIAEPLNSFLGNLKRVDLEGEQSLAIFWLSMFGKSWEEIEVVEDLKVIHAKFVSIFMACMEVVEKINVLLVDGKRTEIEVESAVLEWSKSLALRKDLQGCGLVRQLPWLESRHRAEGVYRFIR